MQIKKKSVCVIGAGASGLVTVKELLEAGHEVVCYEQHDRVAGVFYHGATKGGTYDSTRLTVSNYFMAFSTLPPNRDEARDYWTWKEYADYLERFVDTFGLRESIRLGHTVEHLNTMNDGRVEVTTTSEERLTSQRVFDHVAVCTGTNQTPKEIPSIEGIRTFTGELMHSGTYKNAQPFEGKKVVCVGIGETGADVAHEISDVADECTLSIRRYQALTPRYPHDLGFTNDVVTSIALYALPSRLQNWQVKQQFRFMQRFSKNARNKELARWNLEAGDHFNHFFTKTDDFLDNVVNGRLSLNVGGITKIEGSEVVFNNGERVAADCLVFSTGYTDHFAFLGDREPTDMRRLYKHMISPSFRDRIVFIGWARPGVGGVPACSEMQARYFARLCAGTMSLPTNNRLLELIARQVHFEDTMYKRSPGVRTLVHYSSFVAHFADMLGCSPIRKELLKEPRLLYKVVFGSQLPYLYRLYGQGSQHEESKEVILKLENATNIFIEMLLITLAGAATSLKKARLIKGDPTYQ